MASRWKLVIFLPKIAKQTSNSYKQRFKGAILTKIKFITSLQIIEFRDIKNLFFSQKKEAAHSIQTLLHFYQISRRHIPDKRSVKLMSLPSVWSLYVA